MAEVHSYTSGRHPVTVPSLRRAHRQPTREGQFLLDADLANPPEMYDRLVIAMQPGHQAGGLETIRIHIQWTSIVPAVDRE